MNTAAQVVSQEDYETVGQAIYLFSERLRRSSDCFIQRRKPLGDDPYESCRLRNPKKLSEADGIGGREKNIQNREESMQKEQLIPVL